MPDRPKAVLPAVMTALAFLAFLAVYALLTAGMLEPEWGAGLIFLFPALALLGVTCLTRRGRISVLWGNALTVALSTLFLLTSAVLLLFLVVRDGVRGTEDPALYARAAKLTDRTDPGLLAAFPEEIPAEAENVEFIYTPRFLHGAGVWDLRYTGAGTEALSRMAEWGAEAVFSAPADRWPAAAPLPEGLLPDRLRERDGMTVYVLEAVPCLQDSWNHGRVRLAAASPEGELAFYSTVW